MVAWREKLYIANMENIVLLLAFLGNTMVLMQNIVLQVSMTCAAFQGKNEKINIRMQITSV